MWAFLSTSVGRKLAVGLLALSAVAGAFLYATHLKAQVRAEVAQKDALRSKLERSERELRYAQSELHLVMVNSERNRELLEAEVARERRRSSTVETIIQEVYRDRPPTPAECRAILAPISDAIDGLRDIRAADAPHPAP